MEAEREGGGKGGREAGREEERGGEGGTMVPPGHIYVMGWVDVVAGYR